MKKQIKFNKYQAGGKVSPANTQKAVSAYTDEANRLKGLYAKQPNNDTWLDIPQKTAMYLTGLGYQKPSDFLYAHGLRNVPYHQEAALIADLVADPLNLIPAAGFARNLKRGKIGAGSLPKLGSYVWDAAAGKEVIDYVKSRSSDINNWLGENTGYKFGFGGDLGRYSTGGDIAKGVGAGAYGIGEGLIDNLTFGLTDGITDKGYHALSQLGNNSSQFQKTSNILRSSGNIVGQIGGAIGTGGATTTSAISGGLKAGNDIVQNTNLNDKTKQWIGLGTNLASIGVGFAGGGMNAEIANAPQQLQGILNTSKSLQNSGTGINMLNQQFKKYGGNMYQGGQEVNQVQMQDMIPHNLNYLDKVSENLIQMNGPSHNQGGIKTNAGEFDREETIMKKGVVGNPTPFAFSDNLKISKEVQRQLGLPTNMRNKTIADASKFIENKYETKYNDMPIQRNTKDRMKQSLYTKLMNANKIEFAKNREMNGINSKEDMSFSELNSQYQSGGRVYKKVILDGQEVNKWVGEDNKLYDSQSDIVLPKPEEFSGDMPVQKVEQSQESPTYKYNNIEYKKVDGQWMWKSNKTGALHPAKNFNDDFIERNNLEPGVNKDYKKSTVPQKSIQHKNPYTKKESLSKEERANQAWERMQKDMNLDDEVRADNAWENIQKMMESDNKEQTTGLTGGMYPGTSQGPVNSEQQLMYESLNRLNNKPRSKPQMSNEDRALFEKYRGAHDLLMGNKPKEVKYDRFGIPQYDEYSPSDARKDGKDKYIYDIASGKYILKSDIRHKYGMEVKKYQGGMEVDLFPKKQTYEWNTNNVPQEIPSQYMRNYEVRSKLPNVQAINGTNKTTNWTNYLDYSKNSPQNFMTELQNGDLSTYHIPEGNTIYNISDYMPKKDIINSDMENRARNIKVNTLDIPDITAKMDENDKEIKDKQSNFWNSMSDLEKIGLGANALSTLGQGLTMLKKNKIPTFYNENSSQINNIMSDRRIDMQPMINDLNSQYNAATSKDNSRSWNVQRGLNTNMYNQYAKSLSELGMKEQEMNNQYKSQYAETLNNLGMQNVQARTTQEELQARTDDIRMNNIRQLMANTGNNLSKFAFTKNLADKTINEGKHLLDTMTTDFGINASTAQDFVNKMDDPNWKPIMAIMTKPDYQGNAMQDAFAAIEKLNASRAEKDMYKLDVIAFENSKTKKTTTKTVSGNTTTTETK